MKVGGDAGDGLTDPPILLLSLGVDPDPITGVRKIGTNPPIRVADDIIDRSTTA